MSQLKGLDKSNSQSNIYAKLFILFIIISKLRSKFNFVFIIVINYIIVTSMKYRNGFNIIEKSAIYNLNKMIWKIYSRMAHKCLVYKILIRFDNKNHYWIMLKPFGISIKSHHQGILNSTKTIIGSKIITSWCDLRPNRFNDLCLCVLISSLT